MDAPSRVTVRYGYGWVDHRQTETKEERIDRVWRWRDEEATATNKERLILWMLKVREGGWFREGR
jgi:hypothetical protein